MYSSYKSARPRARNQAIWSFSLAVGFKELNVRLVVLAAGADDRHQNGNCQSYEQLKMYL